MQLKENEILVLEGAEDFDIHCGPTVTTSQVKSISGNLTLRSTAVIASLNNYWATRERNPNHNIVLRFLTTAEAGLESGEPFGSGKKGLEYWQGARFSHVDIEPLRRFLLSLKLDQNLVSFIQSATDQELREKLVRRIEWDMGNRSRDAIQYEIEDKLKIHGEKFRINSHYSCHALPHLLKKVVDLLSTKGEKELRHGDFLSCFDKATTESIPRGELEAIRGGGNLQQLVGMFDAAETARFANKTSIVANPIPIVDGGIARTIVVSNLTKLVRDQRIIFMHGSSGLGKTNLASLISQILGGNWGWVGFRGMPSDQIKDMLSRVAFEMNAFRLSPFLVLDDIDLSQVAQFEREFITSFFLLLMQMGW